MTVIRRCKASIFRPRLANLQCLKPLGHEGDHQWLSTEAEAVEVEVPVGTKQAKGAK